jgi:hypothetical protein
MDKETLKKEIYKTGYIENPKVGMYFSMKYPHLLKEILDITRPIESSYVVNRNLRARVKFLFDYDLDINKIKSNDQWLTFNRKEDTFIDKTGDYRKRGWEKSKINLTEDYYTKIETINILLKNDYYLNFFGKAKNRKLLKENPKLYSSIYHHTMFMDSFNKNNNKLSVRILTIVKYGGDVTNIKCKKCKENFTTFNYKIFDFNTLCYDCFHYNNENKFPKMGWFKNNYGDGWKKEYKKYIKENALRLNNNNQGFSKISQKIFWLIYEKLELNEQKECYFKELNSEYYINHNNSFYFIDFKCGNKLIEFDGVYWHKDSQEKDIRRNKTYEKLGFKLLIINENDLINNKINNKLIDKCLKFIKNEN